MSLFQVAVCECNQPPDNGKGQPREKEAEGKGDQRPSPLRINEGRENVLEKAQSATTQLLLHHIAVSIFEDSPFAESFRGARSQVTASGKSGKENCPTKG